MAKQQTQPAAPGALPRGTYTVTDLAQVRALADPLRLRILGALGRAPRTTKQVAEVLGEKPTKLYHHVEALERVGLIRLTATRPNRGTMEKYYQAVAAQFQVAASALSPEGGAGDQPSAREAMLTSILDTARKELVACLAEGAAAAPDPGEAPLVGRIVLHVSSKKVQVLRRQLLRWIDRLRAAESEAERPGKKGASAPATWAFTVALCRTDSV